MMETDHLRKVAGYDFHDLRRKYDVRTMWSDLDPQWCLLQSQLVARGPGWYSLAELKERFFTNKSKRPGDDLKEALRTDDDTLAWQASHVAHDLIWKCYFLGRWSLSVLCMTKLARKSRSYPLHTLVLRLMQL